MIWINLTCLKRSTKFTRVIFPWPGKNTQSLHTRAKKIYQSTLIHGQKWFWVAFPSEYSILDKSSSPWWILLASKRSVFPHEFCQPKSYVFPSNRPWRICQGKLNSVNENYCSKDTTPFPSLPFPTSRHEVCSSIEKHVWIFSLCGFENVVYWHDFKPSVVCSNPAMCWVTDIARVMATPCIFSMVVHNWKRNSHKWHVSTIGKPFWHQLEKPASQPARHFPENFFKVWQK